MKQRIQTAIAFLLIMAGTLAVLAVVCVSSPELPTGVMEGQVRWIARTLPLFMLAVWAAWLVVPQKNAAPLFPQAVIYSLILLGGAQAVLGLKQVYGFAYSNHSLFTLTGSFFNPGPYSGYLALAFPLALNEYLRLSKPAEKPWNQKLLGYLSGMVVLLIVSLLPAGMSRSAWVAALLSGVWVYAAHCSWISKLVVYRRAHPKRLAGWLVAFLALLLIGGSSLFLFKKDSASGRLFMWKISAKAIAEKPLGHGAGSFPAVYGNMQERYFASGDYTDREELVAGSPEYAFNEYLQAGVEWGVPVLIALLVFIGLSLYRATKRRRTGIAGAILALLVFAFSSYPFQLPVFVITFVFLLAACWVGEKSRSLLLFSLLMGGAGLYLLQVNTYDECREWSRVKMLYQVKAHQSAKQEYEKLYPVLKNRAAFLFEYGHCLHQMEEYEASNRLLQEASRHSCDPMILNVIGKNYQSLGRYEEAEEWLIRSTHLLPGRIYPYYLLTKLYADPAFRQPEKLKETAAVVLTKEPKVQSTAVRQMREEVRKLLEDKE